MNIKVMYHSSTGNTGKLAHAIADCLHTKAEPIGAASGVFAQPVDLLFIGDGIYAGKPSKKTIAFIETLKPETVKYATVFATYGGQAKIGEDMKSLLERQGIKVLGEPFTCKGQAWFFANRHHPDSSDMERARDFAKNILSKIEQ